MNFGKFLRAHCYKTSLVAVFASRLTNQEIVVKCFCFISAYLSQCSNHIVVITYVRSIFQLYRNQPNDFKCRSVDWFLYDRKVRLKCVKKVAFVYMLRE